MIKLPNSYFLEIEQHILARFRGSRQSKINPLESGGILMGKKIGEKFLIDFASTPGAGDKRKINRFIRNKKRAQEIINREREKTNNRRIYLGEWHTHFEENPTPTNLDLREWKLTFNNSLLNINFMFCIIVGLKCELFNLYLSIQTSTSHIKVVGN
jgi:integrative and conjugative element protein (TIGR02256 family)